MRRMGRPCSHLVIGNGHVKAPVHPVLDAPVLTYRLGQSLGIGSQAADIVPSFPRHLVLHLACRLDDRKAAQVWPASRAGQAFQSIEDMPAPRLQPPVILVDGFADLMRRFLGWRRQESLNLPWIP